MRIKNLLLLFVLLTTVGTTQAQAPLAGCWHPDFIKDWVPEKDPDRKFNRSSVPLQPRILTSETVKAHSQQYPEGQVAACLTMHPLCSQVPAQGAYNFLGYNPTYWQYLDLLVWWGGSAGEGIILPPSAPVIDAAHMSGVKVLGQIFFPTQFHGGLPAWTHQMNTAMENGVPYPYARKCAEIAKYYGFDGWFINSETITADWTNWTKEYLRYASEELGLVGQEIQLYDMNSWVGTAAQNVARQKGGSFMVNYGGTSNTITAINGHTNEAEWGNKFESYYAGQEQSGSITANGANFKNLFKATGHVGSVNWFNPEEPTWKTTVSSLLGTNNASGPIAYTAMAAVLRNEQAFWTNSMGNVTSQARGAANTMPGLATAIQERSAIQSLPFVTSFSAGLGKHWFVNGEKKGTQDWYHRGMQTVMPTWRWWVLKGSATTNDISFAYNWDDAYNIGTSINLSGNLTNNTDYTLNLYKTKLAVSAGDYVEFAYKTNRVGSLKLRLGTEAASETTTMYQPLSSTVRNGWTIDRYDLTPLAGQTLRMVSIGINAEDAGSGFTAQLGQLGIYPTNYTPTAFAVKNLQIQNDLNFETGDLRIIWDHPEDIGNVHHYNVYVTRNGDRKLMGQTRNEGFYVHKFNRNGQNEANIEVQVSTVYKNMEEVASTSPITISFPALRLPEIKVVASKSLLNVNEEVTFTAEATNFPDSYEWQAPADGTGTLVSQNGNSAVYKFSTIGKHTVTVLATNPVGTTTHIEEGIVNVNPDASLTIVSRRSHGGSVAGDYHGYDCNSYIIASDENPGYLIDNTVVPTSVNAKWCAGGEKEHWVIVTLNDIYELYRFMIYDCGHKENASDNLTHYKIYTSIDKINWTLALDMQNVPATAQYNTKDHFIAPVFARYVKFIPYDPDKAITIRLWQFDVYGLSATPAPSLSNLKANKRAARMGEQITFTVDAALNPTSFNWIVNGGTKVSQEDNATGSRAVFTFEQEGFYDVKVEATNAGGTKNIELKKILQVSEVEDLISVGKPIVMSSGGTGTEYLTDGVFEPVDIAHKWNATGATDYWAIIDLGQNYDISRFITFDCRSMEPALLHNITHYDIYVANAIDDQGAGDWQLAVRGRNSVNRNIKDDILESSVTGRYVKFAPYSWSLLEIRVFELEIYGKRAVAGITIEEPKNLTMMPNTTHPITLTFGLGDIPKNENFEINVTAEKSDVIEILNKTVTSTEVMFSVQALQLGSSKVFVELINGTDRVQKEFTVTVSTGNSLTDTRSSTLKVWPTPVKKGENLYVESDDAEFIRIVSLQGAVIKQIEATKGVTEIPTFEINRGSYLLQVIGTSPKVTKIIVL